jgi:hypothetical protein
MIETRFNAGFPSEGPDGMEFADLISKRSVTPIVSPK